MASATASSPTNNTSSALAVVQKWFDTLDKSLLSETLEWNVPGYPVPKVQYIGRDDVLSHFFSDLASHFAAWDFKTTAVLPCKDGKHVAVQGAYLPTTKKSGTKIRIPFVHIWKVEEGVIVKVDACAAFPHDLDEESKTRESTVLA